MFRNLINLTQSQYNMNLKIKINMLKRMRRNINNYLRNKTVQKNLNNYNPDNNNINYLLIFACHCDSEIKLNTIRNNLNYFNFDSIKILLINSIGLKYNADVQHICEMYKNVSYMEIDNDKTYDFGKWIYGLNNIDYNNYNFTIFTNDSFIIHSPINHFCNLLQKNNCELYGYNDSTQQKYHYQSYLFAIRKDAINKFIYKFNVKKHTIKNQEDVIKEYEIDMVNWFNKNNCFLTIGKMPINRGLNIFFTNDKLYEKLKKQNLLPFTKIKRITNH